MIPKIHRKGRAFLRFGERLVTVVNKGRISAKTDLALLGRSSLLYMKIILKVPVFLENKPFTVPDRL